jgi:hypothetical protein
MNRVHRECVTRAGFTVVHFDHLQQVGSGCYLEAAVSRDDAGVPNEMESG